LIVMVADDVSNLQTAMTVALTVTVAESDAAAGIAAAKPSTPTAIATTLLRVIKFNIFAPSGFSSDVRSELTFQKKLAQASRK